jgi:hypothetical protein
MDLETNSERSMNCGGGRAYRSRLEGFVDFIREQRQQRQTWQEIAARLRTEKGCVISFQGLHQFYRRHLKRGAHWESEVVTTPMAVEKSPMPLRKPTLAATPAARSYRHPSLENIQLNDPTKL